MGKIIADLLSNAGAEIAKLSISSALVLVVLWLARGLIEVRLKSSVQNEFDTKLERIRSDLRQSEESLKAQVREKEAEIGTLRETSMAALAARRSALDKRRMEACDHLWEQMIMLQKFHGLVAIVSALSDAQIIERARYSADFRNKIELMTTAFRQEDLAKINGNSAQPYVSELAWALFNAYQTIVSFAFAQKHIMVGGLNGNLLNSGRLASLLTTALPEKAAEISQLGDAAGAKFLPDIAQNLLIELKRILDGRAEDEAGITRASELLQLSRAVQNSVNIGTA